MIQDYYCHWGLTGTKERLELLKKIEELYAVGDLAVMDKMTELAYRWENELEDCYGIELSQSVSLKYGYEILSLCDDSELEEILDYTKKVNNYEPIIKNYGTPQCCLIVKFGTLYVNINNLLEKASHISNMELIPFANRMYDCFDNATITLNMNNKTLSMGVCVDMLSIGLVKYPTIQLFKKALTIARYLGNHNEYQDFSVCLELAFMYHNIGVE